MSYIGKQPSVVALTASDITDGIVSNAKLAQDIISADTALGATPADTDEFLVSDAGTLKRMDYSYIKAANTPAFFASHSASQTLTHNTAHKILLDTEKFDTDGTFASNKWTPATAGTYYMYGQVYVSGDNVTELEGCKVKIYKNGAEVTQKILILEMVENITFSNSEFLI